MMENRLDIIKKTLLLIIYLHALGGHSGRLVKNLKLVPARSEGVVTDVVLQGWLLQPAGAEGGAAVGVLEDRVAARCTLWREHCIYSQTQHKQWMLTTGCLWEWSNTVCGMISVVYIFTLQLINSSTSHFITRFHSTKLRDTVEKTWCHLLQKGVTYWIYFSSP